MTNSLLVSNGIASSGVDGIGYSTGAGGTVTQITSKATGVTLNKICGAITLNNAALNTMTAVTFIVTCSACAVGDVVRVNHSSAGTSGAYLVGVSAIGAGSFSITVFNCSGGSLSEAIVVSFSIGKAVSA